MIFYSPYELKRNVKPNKVVSNLVQKGALIKVTDCHGNFGVADLCPWPELGDLNLEQELKLKGPLFQRAVELAKIDLEARKNKITLAQNISVKNHQIVSDFKIFDPEKAVSKVLKIKGDQKIEELAVFLNQLSGVRVRLDFNFILSSELFKHFIDLLSEETIQKIEVIEDPFPFDEIEWKKWDQSVPLALDFNQKNNQWYRRIGKPAREMLKSAIYLTSSMDHPVGIVHGLLEAQKYPETYHGFLTLDHYEHTEFNKYFKQDGETLSYKSDDFGIGFTNELLALNWVPIIQWDQSSQENYLGLNPKASSKEKEDLFLLKQYFSNHISATDYLLIPSSGTSNQENESVKLIALKKESFLANAKMMLKHFDINRTLNWGCVLPFFHVGGLSILARCFLTNSILKVTTWGSHVPHWLEENQIQVLSLVPTQVHDLIQWKIKCPSSLQKVFVGGAALTESQFTEIQKLGWPVVLTYGMTESSSMFAFQKGDEFGIYSLIFGHRLQQDRLITESLASFILQIIDGKIQAQEIDPKKGYEIPDQIEFLNEGRFKVLGRKRNQVKILGEGVSVDYLQSIADQIAFQKMILIPLSHDRNGFQIVAVFEGQIDDFFVKNFNERVRSFERISKIFCVKQFPRTSMGKVKAEEIKQIIKKG